MTVSVGTRSRNKTANCERDSLPVAREKNAVELCRRDLIGMIMCVKVISTCRHQTHTATERERERERERHTRGAVKTFAFFVFTTTEANRIVLW